MDFSFTAEGWEYFEYCMDNDSDISDKIRLLLKSIKQDSFKEIGKSEPLKYELKGYWSRRITGFVRPKGSVSLTV